MKGMPIRQHSEIKLISIYKFATIGAINSCDGDYSWHLSKPVKQMTPHQLLRKYCNLQSHEYSAQKLNIFPIKLTNGLAKGFFNEHFVVLEAQF